MVPQGRPPASSLRGSSLNYFCREKRREGEGQSLRRQQGTARQQQPSCSATAAPLTAGRARGAVTATEVTAAARQRASEREARPPPPRAARPLPEQGVSKRKRPPFRGGHGHAVTGRCPRRRPLSQRPAVGGAAAIGRARSQSARPLRLGRSRRKRCRAEVPRGCVGGAVPR